MACGLRAGAGLAGAADLLNALFRLPLYLWALGALGGGGRTDTLRVLCGAQVLVHAPVLPLALLLLAGVAFGRARLLRAWLLWSPPVLLAEAAEGAVLAHVLRELDQAPLLVAGYTCGWVAYYLLRICGVLLAYNFCLQELRGPLPPRLPK
ncbi:hypothetical protein R5R35_009193 [Gryllus longicercus]|uniref:Uncharacterized protein n=1 Tax=Gryllus longicercus TaxID=2509291 RepID=A0AAN9V6K7_9ORTH